VPIAVCINKYDINITVTEEITHWCRKNWLPIMGWVPYDEAVTAAQLDGESVVDHNGSAAAVAIRRLWEKTAVHLGLQSLQGDQ